MRGENTRWRVAMDQRGAAGTRVRTGSSLHADDGFAELVAQRPETMA